MLFIRRAVVAASVLTVSYATFSQMAYARAGDEGAPQAARSLTPEQWREDLAYLVAQLPKRHVDPFTKITRERWEEQARALDERIPTLEAHEVAVGFAALVASIGDAHTVAYAGSVAPGFGSLPVRLFWFADGPHVAAATAGNEALLGLRLTRVGTTPIDEAAGRVATTLAAENDALFKSGVAQTLTTPEVLHALGLTDSPLEASLGFEGPAGAVDATLARVADAKGAAWVRWPDHAGAPTPLARSKPLSHYWSAMDVSSGVYFIQYNRCQDAPDETVSEFVSRALGEIDGREPRAVVVDLRYNGGGSSRLLRPLISGLRERERLNHPDRLFVLIGRQTFSSALMNAVEFRQRTRATLVGEPTGGKPNHFGETKTFALPNSGMSVQHSTKYFKQQEKDEDALSPDVRVEARAADFGAGRDPVMEEVVRRLGAGG